jgi:hypothetical protein
MSSEYLAAKLAVMKDVKYLRKDKQMEQGARYRYIGEGKIVRLLRKSMILNGLTVAPIRCKLVHHEAVQTAKGGTSHCRILEVTWRLSHVASGQFEDVETVGEAADSGDKGSTKAMTAAKKYALLQAFLIETGDDPDDTSSEQHRRQTADNRPATAAVLHSEQWKVFAKWANAQVPKLFPSADAMKAEILLSAGASWTAETLKTCTDAKVFEDIKEKIVNRSKVAALAN